MHRLLALAATAVLLTTSAQAYFPGQLRQPCERMPPASAQRPLNDFVHIVVKDVPPNRINRLCHVTVNTEMYGCERQIPHYQIWRIYLNAALNPAERACALVYEKAHLPPNNWLDPVVEGWTKGH